MRRSTCLVAWPALALLAAACSLEPSGERPGFWISGEVARELVSDWSFTDGVEEILIETRTGYGLPHSVTIWCVAIDGQIYERRLELISDPALTDTVNRAFGRKYRYDVDEDPDPVVYWRVVDRG